MGLLLLDGEGEDRGLVVVDGFPAKEFGIAGGDGFTCQQIERKEWEHGVYETVASPGSGVFAARFFDTVVALDRIGVGVREADVLAELLKYWVAFFDDFGPGATIGIDGLDAVLEAGDETSGGESR